MSILPYKTFVGETHLNDWFAFDKTVISENAMQSLLFGRDNIEYCLLIPHHLRSKKIADSIRESFANSKYSLYPIACCCKKETGRIFGVVKKAQTPSLDFKEMVTDAYYDLRNFSAVHVFSEGMSFLHNKNIDRTNSKPSITIFESYLATAHSRSIKMCGLEIALNEQTHEIFKKKNLISYPISLQEMRTAKNWKTL